MGKLEFKPIEIGDKAVISSFTWPSDFQNCDFSFANMCSWRFLYDSEFAVAEDQLLIRFKIEKMSRFAYMVPVGTGDFGKAIDLLEQDSLAHGHPLCLLGVTPDTKEKLERIFPSKFMYIVERDYFDYIYSREDLATLSGKKYQQKRNHINNFKRRYAYEYVELSGEMIHECLELESQWFKSNQGKEDVRELTDERRSMIYALNHFVELGLIGGAIRVDGKMVAFTFGAPINHQTFGVHVEKADVNYEGAYTIINQEFCAHLPACFTYVNREEDLGIPGLRQAKLSYQPCILLEKSAAVKRG